MNTPDCVPGSRLLDIAAATFLHVLLPAWVHWNLGCLSGARTVRARYAHTRRIARIHVPVLTSQKLILKNKKIEKQLSENTKKEKCVKKKNMHWNVKMRNA